MTRKMGFNYDIKLKSTIHVCNRQILNAGKFHSYILCKKKVIEKNMTWGGGIRIF